ncbi:MAG: FkbM family methyltransferase [Alphaproteobacteria bacterium]|nr:FkbM family methyltransferase [Alphaproteobacteria bacterium]
MTFAFRDLLAAPPPIRVVDAGAAAFQADVYARLSEQGLCEVVGFEPHREDWARRNAAARPGHRYLPYALGDGTVRRFYECAGGLTNSFFRPNAALTAKFARFDMAIVAEYDIQTHRIDDLAEIGDIDYLKLDVQGGELDIIEGARTALATALVVHTEVEFIPLYVDQPLIGDIDVALRKSGFWMHRLQNVGGGLMQPFTPENPQAGGAGHIVWADAIYVRSFLSFDSLPPDKLIKLAIIMHEVYQSWGLATMALEAHDAQTGGGLRQAYLDKLKEAGIF